jgi:uncharacterized protein YeaO (DUF488 family)
MESAMARCAQQLDVRIKRAYLPPSRRDGARILVDRIWPRGLRKSDAAIERWIRDVAPSTALRRWYGHDPARWEMFQNRYRAELEEKAAILAELRKIAGGRPLTLIYSARDEQHNQAVVLRDVLLR